MSYNKFSGDALQHFDAVLQTNRALEYLGFAKNNLRCEHVEPLLKQLGKEEFSADKVEEHKKALKDRDTIIEKNKKAKSSKKPEEFVPVVDQLEEEKTVNANGEPQINYFLVKNAQFRHINLCLNDLDESFKEPLS